MHYTTVLGYGNCTHGAMQLVGAGSIGESGSVFRTDTGNCVCVNILLISSIQQSKNYIAFC